MNPLAAARAERELRAVPERSKECVLVRLYGAALSARAQGRSLAPQVVSDEIERAFAAGAAPASSGPLIGERVRVLRLLARIPREQAAGSHSVQALNKLERGAIENPSLALLRDLAAGLRVPLAVLLDQELYERWLLQLAQPGSALGAAR